MPTSNHSYVHRKTPNKMYYAKGKSFLVDNDKVRELTENMVLAHWEYNAFYD